MGSQLRVVTPEPRKLDLIPRAPRTIDKAVLARLRSPAFMPLFAVGIFFSIFGSVFGCVFGWRTPIDMTISAGASSARGTIVSAKIDRSMKSNGHSPLVVRYRVDGEEEHSALYDYDVDHLPKAGESVLLERSRYVPSWTRVVDGYASSFGPFGILAGFFLPIGLTFVILSVRSRRRRIRAYTEGTPIWAKVTSAGLNRRMRINGRNPFQVEWTFTVSGTTYRGRMMAMDPATLGELADADHVIVLYDPMEPGCNAAYFG